MGLNATKLTERDIQNTLIDLGTPPSLLGFTYLTKAIALTYENPEYRRFITKKLYPEVAKVGNTTPARAERAIRHAIEITWTRGNPEVLATMFGNTVPKGGKPTNSEFISMVVLRIEQSLKEVQEQSPVSTTRRGKWIYWDGWLGNHDQRIDDAKCSECGYQHPVVRREMGEHYGSTINKLARECPCCKAQMDV